MRASMHKNIFLLFITLVLNATNPLYAVSSNPLLLEDIQEDEFDQELQDAQQAWLDFEAALEHHPDQEVHHLVRSIEEDILKTTQYMAAILLRVIEQEKQTIVSACTESSEPLLEVSLDIYELLQEVDQALRAEIFIEDDRDAMQQGNIIDYFNYQKMVLNQFQDMLNFCMLFMRSTREVSDYTHAFNPSYRAARAIMTSPRYTLMTELSKHVCKSAILCLQDALPTVLEHHYGMLTKSLRLIDATKCTSQQYVLFVDARMCHVSFVFRALFNESIQEYVSLYEQNPDADSAPADKVNEMLTFVRSMLQTYVQLT